MIRIKKLSRYIKKQIRKSAPYALLSCAGSLGIVAFLALGVTVTAHREDYDAPTTLTWILLFALFSFVFFVLLRMAAAMRTEQEKHEGVQSE